jgi:hypothetical protein
MSRRKLVVLTAAAIGTAAVTGVSVAYWTGGGSGVGNAGAAANLAGVTIVSVTAGDTPASSLLPGHPAEAIVKVANTNSFPVTITSVALRAGQPVTAANGCSPTGVSFTDQTGTWAVPANSAGTLINLPGSVQMSTASASACQGTTFSIPVTITAQR